ncbi:MAG: MFS transporter [Pseudomonas marincola]|uniref:MFS transporter n=1 Tax=Pseudomonas marincola TaxID=437900 RepID=UPI003001CF82
MQAHASTPSDVTESRLSLHSAYVVALCTLGYVFAYLDRQITSLLVEQIQADLALTDTQFSLLHGLAFSLFYVLLGLPIARMADTKNRPRIIACGMLVWSLATSVCGLARSFAELFIARVAVGCGEAALSPAAYSIISDIVPRRRLGFALGLYSSGAFIGAAAAFIAGGIAIEVLAEQGALHLPLLGEIKPWRATFMLVGLPGLLLGVLFLLTVADPKRLGRGKTRGYSVRQVMEYLALHRGTFIAHMGGFSLLAATLFSLMSWAPAFFLRNFDLSTREVGLILGLVTLGANCFGAVTGGWLSDWLINRGHSDGAFRAGIIGALGTLPPVMLFAHMPSLEGALLIYALAMFFASFPLAISTSALQRLVPNQMRAQISAVFFVGINIFAFTGGTTLVALLTDNLFENSASVGYAMACVASISALAGALCLGFGLKSCRQTMCER